MVLLTPEMVQMQIKVHSCWRRYDHYNIQYIVPSNEDCIKRFVEIMNGWIPGEEEFSQSGWTIDHSIFKSAGDPRLESGGTTLVKVEVYYAKFERSEGSGISGECSAAASMQS